MEVGIIVMAVMMVGMMFGMGWMHGKHKNHACHDRKNQDQTEIRKSTGSALSNFSQDEHQH